MKNRRIVWQKIKPEAKLIYITDMLYHKLTELKLLADAVQSSGFITVSE